MDRVTAKYSNCTKFFAIVPDSHLHENTSCVLFLSPSHPPPPTPHPKPLPLFKELRVHTVHLRARIIQATFLATSFLLIKKLGLDLGAKPSSVEPSWVPPAPGYGGKG